MSCRSWKLIIPAPVEWITTNKHKSHRGRSPLTAQWRAAAYAAARAARLPTGLARIRIEPEARFRAGRKSPVREMPNLSFTVKAVVDGLGPRRHGKDPSGRLWVAPGWGLVPDDDDAHVDLVATRRGKPLPAAPYGNAGELVLHITELAPIQPEEGNTHA